MKRASYRSEAAEQLRLFEPQDVSEDASVREASQIDARGIDRIFARDFIEHPHDRPGVRTRYRHIPGICPRLRREYGIAATARRPEPRPDVLIALTIAAM